MAVDVKILLLNDIVRSLRLGGLCVASRAGLVERNTSPSPDWEQWDLDVVILGLCWFWRSNQRAKQSIQQGFCGARHAAEDLKTSDWSRPNSTLGGVSPHPCP